MSTPADTIESLLRPQPSGLLPFVLASLVGHLLFLLVAVALSWALSGPRITLEQKPIQASLVRLGKPRDEKLLPRKEESPPAPPTKPAAVEPPAATAEPSQPVKLASKVAAPTAPVKKSTPAAPTAKKTLFDAFTKTARAGKAAPLEGALDGDPEGDSATQEGERYFGLLKAVVQRNYDVSDTIPEAERRTLKAEVALWIGPGGEVRDAKLSKPSGNDLFDAAVVGAVKKAAPFSPPPPHLVDTLKRQGVAIVFRAADE